MKSLIQTCLLAALLGACTSTTSSPAASTSPPGASPETPLHAQSIRVTRATNAGPEPCHPEQVGRLVAQFFAAVNQGQADLVPSFFATRFDWYSVTEGNPRKGGRHFVARDSNKLLEHFHQRVELQERLLLNEIDVVYEGGRNLGHVVYSLRRTADDLDGYAPMMGGKGAIDCDEGRIKAWSMGQRKKPWRMDICPGRSDDTSVAIACSR